MIVKIGKMLLCVEKMSDKIWWIRKYALPLHQFKKCIAGWSSGSSLGS